MPRRRLSPGGPEPARSPKRQSLSPRLGDTNQGSAKSRASRPKGAALHRRSTRPNPGPLQEPQASPPGRCLQCRGPSQAVPVLLRRGALSPAAPPRVSDIPRLPGSVYLRRSGPAAILPRWIRSAPQPVARDPRLRGASIFCKGWGSAPAIPKFDWGARRDPEVLFFSGQRLGRPRSSLKELLSLVTSSHTPILVVHVARTL